MSAIFLVLFLVMCGNCDGRSPPVEPRQSDNSWPTRGIRYCRRILDIPTRQNCTECFRDGGADWIQASACAADWLPLKYAMCSRSVNAGNNGIGAQNIFESCLATADNKQQRENNRARAIYKKGGEYLALVGDSKIIEDGGSAMFSCMGQELLIQTRNLQDELGESCGPCFDRFQMDPVNQHWHLNKNDRPQRSQDRPETAGEIAESQLTKEKNSARMNHLNERTLVYEYGYVGHDMPFHGIGPLAVDILKGECIFQSLKEDADLNELVAAIWNSPNPVPAWIFREILNHITSITLPD